MMKNDFSSANLVSFTSFSFASSAVDGVDIRNSSHELAVKTIKNASNKMTMMVASLNAGVIRFLFHCLEQKTFFFKLCF